MESNHLNSLPSNLFSDTGNLEIVNFANNRISTIDPLVFQGAFKLRALNLSLNQITKIQKSTFDGLQALEIVDLSNNLIEEIDKDLFKDVSHLKKFNVAKNQLKILLMIPKCSYLVASDNQIQLITFRAHALLEMIEFNVANNHIDNIPEILQHLGTSLIDLNLSNNYVGVLNVATFSLFRNLEQLNLRNTSISHIEFGTFHLPSLLALDISLNSLEENDFDMLRWGLSNLKKISLRGYPVKNLKHFNKRIFKMLTEISIGDIENNCDDLSKSLEFWTLEGIEIITDAIPTDVRLNQSHINGITCYYDRSGNVRSIDAKNSEKPNEEITDSTHKLVLLASCIIIATFICAIIYLSFKKIRAAIRRCIEHREEEQRRWVMYATLLVL